MPNLLSADTGREMAAIISDLDRRVSRLETLEFTTVAFPIGGCELIEDLFLTSDKASITFGDALSGGVIPNTYRHLWIWALPILPNNIAATDMMMRFNSDTANFYVRYKVAFSNDLVTMASFTTADSGGEAEDYIDVGEIGTTQNAALVWSGHEINIFDYTNEARRKTVVFKSYKQHNAVVDDIAQVTGIVTLGGGSWSRNDAIENITLAPLSGADFGSGSRFTLYGRC